MVGLEVGWLPAPAGFVATLPSEAEAITPVDGVGLLEGGVGFDLLDSGELVDAGC